jgi:hypothetical protein
MTRTRELLALITGFAAGTLLGAMYVSLGRKSNAKLKEETQKQKQKIRELKDLVESVG